MSYLNYDGLAYFKSKLTNWVDQNYLSKTNTGNITVAGNVTFTKPITGDLDGKAKKDWLGQKIDETYIKNISVNDNAGQIVYTKGNGSSNYIMIDLMHGATASAVGKAGLVPAPKISERDKFLRGDGEWGVPTDVYVTQNMISTNDSFPILIGATAGATTSQVGTPIAFGTKVSVNPYTHTLIADHLILKHPTYRRSNNVSSKIMYTLNFADSDDGNGNNLSEIYGYIDPVADGGEHELGFRLFGNPNVQGVEEIFTYLSVGLSKTNIPYGHAPKTPVPAEHNEDTDIITRSYLKLNGSITGLVHTTMDETIGGIKTFTDETRNTSSAGITTTKLTASGKITGTGTAEISGGSGSTPSLKVTGNETVTGDLNVGGNETVAGNETVTGNISTTNGNISTTNGTVSGKTGSIGTGGLTVTGPSNLNGGASITGNETVSGTLTVGGKITGNGGAEISGGNGLKVNGNETVTGKLTAEDLEATDDLTVGDTATVGGQILKKTGTNTTQEYVSYVTNQQETRNTIITNVVKPNGGLAIVDSGTDKGKIYVKTGNALEIDSNGFVNVDFSKLPPDQVKSIVDRMVDPDGAIIGSTQEYIPAGETYHYYDNNGNLVSAVAPAGGIANPNYGKLTVDFSKLSPSQIEAIVLSMIAQDGQGHLTGGLATDDNGKLIVDFSQMPDDRFDTLKASLGMQRTVTSSTRTFYVEFDNVNASNTIYSKANGFDSERGLSLDKPFKTINGAINAITTYYSIGDQSVVVYVVPRHKLIDSNTQQDLTDYTGYPYYYENINLPTYNRTSGSITIRGYIDTSKNEVEYNSPIGEPAEGVRAPMPKLLCKSICGTLISANGRYTLRYLDLYNRVRDPASASSSVYPQVIGVGSGGDVSIYGIHEHFEFYGHKGKIGTLTIPNVTTEPTTIIINKTNSATGAVTVVSEGKYQGYEYSYDPTHDVETARERPELEITTGKDTSGSSITANSYITVVSYSYSTTNQTVTLKYTFSRENTDVKVIDFYYKIDNGSFVKVSPIYENYTDTNSEQHTTNLESASNIQMRTNCVVDGRLHLSILDGCNCYFKFNTYSSNEALDPDHGNLEPTFNNFNTGQLKQVNNWVVLRAERGGKIENSSSASVTFPYTNLYYEGNTNNFLELSANANYTNVSGQIHYMHHVVPYGKTVTGKPFEIGAGCGCSVSSSITETKAGNGNAISNYSWSLGVAGHAFPGTVTVTQESESTVTTYTYGDISEEADYTTRNERRRYGNAGSYYFESDSTGS